MLRPGRSRARALERTRTTTEWPFAWASRTISRPLPPVAPTQEPLCLNSIFIDVNVVIHAVTAFWAAAKTSRADIVPAMCEYSIDRDQWFQAIVDSAAKSAAAAADSSRLSTMMLMYGDLSVVGMGCSARLALDTSTVQR